MDLTRLFALFIVFLFSSQAIGESLHTWSEGLCNKDKVIFEGATRDYFNRGGSFEWKNKGGDWVDDFFVPQGNRPFHNLTSKNNGKEFSGNVTNLVNLWVTKGLANHGFYIKPTKRNKVKFYTKESKASQGARLELVSNQQLISLPVQLDTEIDISTYTCKGQNELINGSLPFLLKFDLSNITEPVKSATLFLPYTSAQKNDEQFQVFAINIPEVLHNPRQGFSGRLSNQKKLVSDPRVYFYNDFSNGSDSTVLEAWRTNQKVINSNPDEKFSPLYGETLQVTINKGSHLGASKHFKLDQLKLNEAFFRYHLRFGDSWEAITGGKLPGFAGTYSSTSAAAGWGGRKSNGNNGWSARGAFGTTTSQINAIPNKTPLGIYLYHADMKNTWGDQIAFNQSPAGMLEKNKWYAVEQYIKLNEPNKNNGILQAWVNGHLVLSKTNVRFTDDPRLKIEEIWFNVYHGGKLSAPKDLTLFFDDLVVASEYIGSPLIDMDNNEKPN